MDFAFNFDLELSMTVIAIAVLFIVILLQALYIRFLTNRINVMDFQKRSQSSKYGKMTEQFLPFLDVFPWDANNFRFLGSPIDGVQFEDDEIIFVEFKSSRSSLSIRQKDIKKLIEGNKVSFEEIRIDL